MLDFDLVPLDPRDHGLVQSWLALREAVQAHDIGDLVGRWTPTRSMMSLIQRSADTDNERWIAVRDGAVLASVGLAFPLRDNTHLAFTEVEVHPAHRGEGIGTELVGHAERRAAENGRSSVTAWMATPVPEGPEFRGGDVAFADRHGYRPVLNQAMRVCDLDRVEDAELGRLWDRAWTHAGGFEIVEWIGTPSEDLLDGLAHLNERMYTDPPMGEWDLGEAEFDAARVLDREREQRERGDLHLQVAARHRESGEVAGYTEIAIEAGREHHCSQGDTIVDPRYRGHRLGTILKIANQRRVRRWRPRMRYVWTGNADSNRHMIAINEAVGYRLTFMELILQKKLA